VELYFHHFKVVLRYKGVSLHCVYLITFSKENHEFEAQTAYNIIYHLTLVSCFEDTLLTKTNGMPTENCTVPKFICDLHRMPLH
jgi:hypothetical protein